MLADFELALLLVSISIASISYFLLAKFNFKFLSKYKASIYISILYMQLCFFLLVKYLSIDDRYFYLFPFELFYIYFFNEYVVDRGKRLRNDLILLGGTLLLLASYIFVIQSINFYYEFEYLLFYQSVVLLLLLYSLFKFCLIPKNLDKNDRSNNVYLQLLALLCISELTIFTFSILTGFTLESLQFDLFAYLIFLILILTIFIYRATSGLNRKVDFVNDNPTVENDNFANEILSNVTSEMKKNEDEIIIVEKYQKSRLNFEELQNIRIKLQKIADDEMFLNPELNLETLSTTLKISKHHISQAFSSIYGTNFKDHVNTLRCEYALKHILKQESSENIIEIAYLSGFNSKTSFYRAFNKIYKCSPIEFKQKTMN